MVGETETGERRTERRGETSVIEYNDDGSPSRGKCHVILWLLIENQAREISAFRCAPFCGGPRMANTV